MKAVFNSSPIIFLTKLGIIEPALDLFDRIEIPSMVYMEIRRKPDASAEAVEDLIKKRRVPDKCKAYSLGYPPSADLDHSLNLADRLESEEIARKLSLRK